MIVPCIHRRSHSCILNVNTFLLINSNGKRGRLKPSVCRFCWASSVPERRVYLQWLCVLLQPSKHRDVKKEQARHKLKQAFFFLGIISKWHLFGGFCCFFLFSVNLYQMLYSGLFVWRGLTACSPFYKTIVLNFFQTRSEDHSGFSSPLFSPGGGALVEIKSDFPFFFPPAFFKNPRHQCCRGAVAECCLDITVNPAALGLKEIS